MKHDLLLVEHKNKRFAYTRGMLESAGYAAVDSSVKTSDKGVLNQEAFAKEGAVGVVGVWCAISTKDQWLDGDNSFVENKITDQKAPFVRHGERWESVVVERGVSAWNLDSYEPKWVPTEEGLAQMPIKVAGLVKALVVGELYGDTDDPLSPTPSTPL